ncbi:DUF3106 domain-containing protein [Cellvibrio sp. UBA7671]|uniref:DUF3106 domain-containing protein n=1 Tax=Cellvibrio sp. UBA7671 TaxID=1946312 RepID=UPI002F35F70A
MSNIKSGFLIKKSVVILLLGWLATMPSIGVAKDKLWSDLTSEQQALLLNVKDQWPELSPELREKLVTQAEKFKHMTPAEQAVLRERFNRWQNLSPERKAQLRALSRISSAACGRKSQTETAC